ncbi:MAG: D-alanyl-D-alanine carboxypeptidase/D-alanyl-D-alanine-endopeptidase [Actinobacteria bacterium]|nr:D-alanyl-D-alanine carboxypeptidase/D-alanyl-D-alanine-endopeptidase [Actinomycetota bacterium]
MRALGTRRARPLVALTSLALLLLLLLLVPGVASAALKDRISATLARYGMSGRGTSAAVFDLTAKRAVYQLRPDALRLPASNEKLVTSSAALASWTAEFRFSTQLFVDAPGPDEEGVVRGNVYLRGLGDATLSTASFQRRRWSMKTGDIQDFVRRLRKLGITRVTGRVVADEGYFDAARSVANWRPSVLAFCAPLSALTLNESTASGGGFVQDPALATARSLTRRLRDAGIRVPHAPVRGVVPDTALLMHTERSAPLARVLAKMNKPSDNFLAEELLKGLGAGFGAGGSTASGAAVAARHLKSLGIEKGFRIRDGSGLSYQNKLSARTVVKILGAMAKRPDFTVFRRSLAVAGVDGTLRYRMRGTAAAGNVRAKTGTLAAASSLSGYVTTANGHTLSFALLMNGSPVDVGRAHAAQDAVAVLLAKSSP